MMQNPTKITKRIVRPFATGEGTSDTTEEVAAVHSVELKEDAKGSVRVESYKVYSNDPAEAERLALEGMFRTRAKIAEATEAKMHEQLEASVNADKAGKS